MEIASSENRSHLQHSLGHLGRPFPSALFRTSRYGTDQPPHDLARYGYGNWRIRLGILVGLLQPSPTLADRGCRIYWKNPGASWISFQLSHGASSGRIWLDIDHQWSNLVVSIRGNFIGLKARKLAASLVIRKSWKKQVYIFKLHSTPLPVSITSGTRSFIGRWFQITFLSILLSIISLVFSK